MDTKTNDADTKGNAKAIAELAGPHALLTLNTCGVVDIYICRMYVRVPHLLQQALYHCTCAHQILLFYFGQPQNWTGKSEHQEIYLVCSECAI